MKKVIVSLCAIAFCGFISLQAEEKKTDKGAEKPKVSKEEQFKKADTNSDGFLSKEEFVAAFGKKDAAKAEERYKKLDKKGDGKVDLAAFSAAGGKKKDK